MDKEQLIKAEEDEETDELQSPARIPHFVTGDEKRSEVLFDESVKVETVNGVHIDKAFIPDHHSGIAWLSLLFCCLPVALTAVIYSNKVIRNIRDGEIETAYRNSYIAKHIAIAAIIFGAALIAMVLGTFYCIKFNV